MADRLPRKLAAILYGDVAGYSRLTGDDEDETHRRLSEYLDIIAGEVEKHHGRVMHYAGDAVLAMFDAVVDAVACAMAVQTSLTHRNADLATERRVEFRIGVNLGDVIEDRGDIYGDGVNIAARLESLAEPGGVCVSDAVRAAIGNKLDLGFADLGEQTVKNISAPVRAFLVKSSTTPTAATDPGRERPAIAVLPFSNMSGDSEQEYFVDGLTEDIITELSRFQELFVISRNSSFVYKGQATNIREIAQELDVQFVLEGSVRKAGSRVRITVQLIEADSDRHVWAERYDRQLEDIFDLQDEMTSSIVAVLPGRIESAERDRLERKPTQSMAAYECVLKGKVLHHRSTREDNRQALELLDNAIALAPKYAQAHAWRACPLGQQLGYGWCADRDATWVEISKELEASLALTDNDADLHRLMGAISIMRGDHEQAEHHHRRGLSLNPNYDLLVVQQGELHTWRGSADDGIEWIQRAMRLNPHHPERFWAHLGRAYFVGKRYTEAIDSFKQVSALTEPVRVMLAGCYAAMGEEKLALDQTKSILEANPDFNVDDYMNTLHYAQPEDIEHHRQALIQAELPTSPTVS